MQGRGEKSQGGFRVHGAIFGAICRCCGRSCAMTVNERGQQTAINITGYGNVMWVRLKMADRFTAIPITFNLMSVFVQAAATVAMSHVVGVKILKGILSHFIFSNVIFVVLTREMVLSSD